MTMADEEIPDTAQHYLVCGSELCEKSCQVYCNDCHKPMCEQCRNEHQKNQDTKNHEVVPYKQRKPKLPVEKCKFHPTRNIEILCKDCNMPICFKCVVKKGHSGHKLEDLEEIYAENFKCCQEEISKIQKIFMSTSQNLKMEVQEDRINIKKVMNDIRDSIKADSESLRELLEMVTSKKLEEVNTIEKSIIAMLNSQETTYDEYIKYLENLDKELSSFLSLTNIKELFSDEFENLKTKSIPDTPKPVLPVFSSGQFCDDDVYKLLGNVYIPNIKPDKREIKPMENSLTLLKSTDKRKQEDKEKSNVKQTLSSSVSNVKKYTVPHVDSVFHLSLGKSGRLWVSDSQGKLLQTDLQGNQLQKITTNGKGEGYHTVTQHGDLIYTDNKAINRITLDNTITEFIKTGEWEPFSIHSSHINGDLLVGMRKDREGKVTRYKTGTEIQNIQRDNEGQKLFSAIPAYITENINGDVCVSDYHKKAVVVMNKLGQHRFSYTGQGSGILPYGICTDVLGHILVCDRISDTVHLLNQDGQFLSLLLTPQQGVTCPRSLCVDDEHNFLVGQTFTNTVTVYKYLQ
nr:uncharacterized protein LOC117682993 [Crassostrea gigas]